jgi:pyruvate dehydrogenase E1 component beta subunit
MGFAPTTCPTTPVLEELFYPNGQTIAQFVHDTCLGKSSPWTPQPVDFSDSLEFKGPF